MLLLLMMMMIMMMMMMMTAIAQTLKYMYRYRKGYNGVKWFLHSCILASVSHPTEGGCSTCWKATSRKGLTWGLPGQNRRVMRDAKDAVATPTVQEDGGWLWICLPLFFSQRQIKAKSSRRGDVWVFYCHASSPERNYIGSKGVEQILTHDGCYSGARL